MKRKRIDWRRLRRNAIAARDMFYDQSSIWIMLPSELDETTWRFIASIASAQLQPKKKARRGK